MAGGALEAARKGASPESPRTLLGRPHEADLGIRQGLIALTDGGMRWTSTASPLVEKRRNHREPPHDSLSGNAVTGIVAEVAYSTIEE
jgi:hypothetical protein